MQYDINTLIKGFEAQNEERISALKAERDKFQAKLDKMEQEGEEDFQSIGEAISHLSDLWNEGHKFSKTELATCFQKPKEETLGYYGQRYMGYDQGGMDDMNRKINQHDRLIQAKEDTPVIRLLKAWRDQGVKTVSDYAIEKAGFTGYKFGHIFLKGQDLD